MSRSATLDTRIVPLRRRDLPTVVEIERAAYPRPWSLETFRGELARQGRVYLGAQEPSGLIGYIGAQIIDTDAHVLTVAVSRSHRGQGVGGRLLAALLHALDQRGVTDVTLEVRVSNLAALRLYERAGFVREGLRPRYYEDNGEDAVIMWLHGLSESFVAVREFAGPHGGGCPETGVEGRCAGAGSALDCTQSASVRQAPASELTRERAVLVLGIETSCDETAVGVVEDRFTVRSNVIASQADLHAEYGGVVPEVAARAHLELMLPTVDRALAEAGCNLGDIDAVAVTSGPGLVGALLVGVSAAKGLALAEGLPLLGVNHLRAHVEAAQLEYGELRPPLLALVVSGGHTSLVAMEADGRFRQLGSTIDDAAGEAFDKIARFIGLGYPGGPEIDRLAVRGNPAAIDFPRAMLHEPGYDFSLSGLKTSVIRYLRRLEAAGQEPDLADVAASFQEAIVDVQVIKSMRAAGDEGFDTMVLAGGVAANTRLRTQMAEACQKADIQLLVPHVELCTDNGAMVAASGANLLAAGRSADLDLAVDPNLPLAG